ncbi:MAG: hypothetical protein Q9222_001773 [Ikaeria aurantiellina]
MGQANSRVSNGGISAPADDQSHEEGHRPTLSGSWPLDEIDRDNDPSSSGSIDKIDCDNDPSSSESTDEVDHDNSASSLGSFDEIDSDSETTFGSTDVSGQETHHDSIMADGKLELRLETIVDVKGLSKEAADRFKALISDAWHEFGIKKPLFCREPKDAPNNRGEEVVFATSTGGFPQDVGADNTGLVVAHEWVSKYYYWALDVDGERYIVNLSQGYRNMPAAYRQWLGKKGSTEQRWSEKNLAFKFSEVDEVLSYASKKRSRTSSDDSSAGDIGLISTSSPRVTRAALKARGSARNGKEIESERIDPDVSQACIMGKTIFFNHLGEILYSYANSSSVSSDDDIEGVRHGKRRRFARKIVVEDSEDSN